MRKSLAAAILLLLAACGVAGDPVKDGAKMSYSEAISLSGWVNR